MTEQRKDEVDEELAAASIANALPNSRKPKTSNAKACIGIQSTLSVE